MTYREKHPILLLVLAAAACALAFISCAQADAAGESDLVFSAKRSLTGNCSTSVDDPIPDPGCPGGAHPPRQFDNPCGTATDAYGNIYVASEAPAGAEGRIDVFNSKGEYLTEVVNEHKPCDLAVDSEGNLYAMEHDSTKRLVVYPPVSFPPVSGSQFEAPVLVHAIPPVGTCGEPVGIAVDPSNDHLYVGYVCPGESIFEYGSAAENLPTEGWTAIREGIGVGADLDSYVAGGLDVYGANHYIYGAGFSRTASDGSFPEAQRIYVLNGVTNEKVCESDGSDTPAGEFTYIFGNAAVSVDQSDGSFYVDDVQTHKVVNHLGPDCKYIDQLPHPPTLSHPDFRPALAVDAPCKGSGEAPCNLGGYFSPNDGYIYVGSGHSSTSRLFAFKPRSGAPPAIEAQAAVEITGTEAKLTAKLNPNDLETTYHFEYITQADYEADGGEFGAGSSSTPVPEGELEEGDSSIEVAASIASLAPGTAYRFHLVAGNEEGTTLGEGAPGDPGSDASFATYAIEAPGLPDGRGYELVTPPDTGGYVPTLSEFGAPNKRGDPPVFATNPAAPGGNGLLFGIEGGSMPGFPGGGFHDTYEANREPGGSWQSDFNGLSGAEAASPFPLAFSADHGLSFWEVELSTLLPEGVYVRRSSGVLDPSCSPEPATKLELLGCGSLGTDQFAGGGWISPGGGHVIFATQAENLTEPQQLEPEAAPTGTAAVYDRTADGVTHVISLKPDNSSFAATEKAFFRGASEDGTAVAFEVDGTLYVRASNFETLTVAEGGNAIFGGLSSDGSRIVYLEPNSGEPHLPGTGIPQGDIFVCDLDAAPCTGPGSQGALPVGTGEKSVVVNVSADASHVYFVSPMVLDDAEDGEQGEDNLYVWDGTDIRFVASLDPLDVTGRVVGAWHAGGLGLWLTSVVGPSLGVFNGPANDPSRTTPDGSVLVFESRAEIGGFESAGHSEIYRYETAAGSVSCLSCNLTGAAASSDAQLESDPPPQFVTQPPVSALSIIPNLSENGQRVFFQSGERLVLGDTDGKIDVYQWEAEGEGDCTRQDGCVRLISSGQSPDDEYLYAATPDGSNVFFESGDLLVAEDHDVTPSIYDARIGGGAPPVVDPPKACLGDACQPPAFLPSDLTPASSLPGPGNPKPDSRCKRGRHKVRLKGRVRCVKHHLRHRENAHNNRRASR